MFSKRACPLSQAMRVFGAGVTGSGGGENKQNMKGRAPPVPAYCSWYVGTGGAYQLFKYQQFKIVVDLPVPAYQLLFTLQHFLKLRREMCNTFSNQYSHHLHSLNSYINYRIVSIWNLVERSILGGTIRRELLWFYMCAKNVTISLDVLHNW